MTYADEPTGPIQSTAPVPTPQETPMSTSPDSPSWQDDEPTRPIGTMQPHPVPSAKPSSRPLRLIPLVLGIIYLGAVLTWGLFQLDLLRAADLDLVLPAVLVTAGGLGLAASVYSVRRSDT